MVLNCLIVVSNEIVNESSDSYRIIWVVKVCISHNFSFTLNVFRKTIFFFKISDCKIGNCKWRSKFGWRLSVDHERHRQRVSGWLRRIKINYFNLLSGVFILNLVKPSVKSESLRFFVSIFLIVLFLTRTITTTNPTMLGSANAAPSRTPALPKFAWRAAVQKSGNWRQIWRRTRTARGSASSALWRTASTSSSARPAKHRRPKKWRWRQQFRKTNVKTSWSCVQVKRQIFWNVLVSSVC